MFKDPNGLFADDRWKILDKFVKRHANFEIFEQGSYRNTRSRENGGTAHHLSVDRYRKIFVYRDHNLVGKLNRPTTRAPS